MQQPLVPFSSPFAVALKYGVGAHQLLAGVVLLGFALWLLFTLVVLYHWLRYSHAALLSIPSIFAHLFASGVLILFTLNALAAL